MMSRLLHSSIFYFAAAVGAILLLLLNLGRTDGVAAPREPARASRVVVVELFTSEGCSSCPPADALLKELSEQQQLDGVQVLALEEHVDYWNHLGWRDPYSAPEFSQRQNDYARLFKADGAYTPQMVVDGQRELLGSRGREARDAIRNAAGQPKAEIILLSRANAAPGKLTFEVRIKNLNGISVRGATELWMAVTERGLQTDVKAGENSGETLRHAAVVRSLRKIDTIRDVAGYSRQTQAALDPGWRKENLALVVFLTEKDSRKIIGAAAAPVNSSGALN